MVLRVRSKSGPMDQTLGPGIHFDVIIRVGINVSVYRPTGAPTSGGYVDSNKAAKPTKVMLKPFEPAHCQCCSLPPFEVWPLPSDENRYYI